MRRAIMTAAIAALTLAGGAMEATGSSAEPRQAHLLAAAPGTQTQEIREKTCRYQWLQLGTWTAREERRTALCVLERWPVPGGFDTFSRIISCESGWFRGAYNPAGPYVGLGQHALSSWYGRVTAYMPDAWKIGSWTRWRNSRAMLATTAHMMHSVGLSPWSCA